MAVFLQYEEPGFSPLSVHPKILSARREVIMSAIVQHGATWLLIFHLWGITILLRFSLHLNGYFQQVVACLLPLL